MNNLEKLNVILDYKIALIEADVKEYTELKNKYEVEDNKEKVAYWENAIKRNKDIAYGIQQAKEAISTLK